MANRLTLTCHIGRASLARSRSGRQWAGDKLTSRPRRTILLDRGNGAPRRRALAPAKATADREDGAGVSSDDGGDAMALRPGRGIHALTLSILLVTACSTGGTQSGGAPLPGCNSGTKQALFWTSHTPPDTDSEQNIVNAFNKQ